MVYITTKSLLGFTFLYLPIFSIAISPATKDTDIICSTTDPIDCYPRLFEPTKDFQDIKEGQDIPPGLHVRLNIYTGVREARLNIPMEGESDAALEELPTDQAVVVVEQPEPETEPIEEKAALGDQIPNKPPAYNAAGKVAPPPASGNDMSTFEKAILVIQMEARAFDQGLDDLLELSHDVYYGVEIAKDGPVLERLICFTLGSGTDRFPANEKEREHKAASIVASSIQNNPTALKEVGDYWRLVMYPTCGTELMDAQTRGKGDFVSRLRSRLGKEKDPATLKAKVTAISGLLKEPKIRADFLDKGGMELLLAIFLKKGEQWDIVKKKVGQLVMDKFLDEGMGAQLGQWPKKAVSDSTSCESKGKMLKDGCWEHHVEKYAKASGQEWTEDLLVALKEQMGKGGDSKYDRGL